MMNIEPMRLNVLLFVGAKLVKILQTCIALPLKVTKRYEKGQEAAPRSSASAIPEQVRLPVAFPALRVSYIIILTGCPSWVFFCAIISFCTFFALECENCFVPLHRKTVRR